MKKLHELDTSIQVEIVKSAGAVLANNFSWPGGADGKRAAKDIVISVVDAFLSLYPEEKTQAEKIEDPKNDPDEIPQKRKYTRRSTE
ncbi:spermidine/putrescine ABC transporter substrate-binding protein [Klebsiella oxytoca KONIH1]|uniref:hypothetical protein n=1 Tax=Klebsiella TaxID=570 RepID=UPI0004A860F3|nr:MULTISPECIES: hypothetical protein [Klebsiella]AID91015.1 spermidine/putrescine ABC transporter substrate-binding protein [Klebsiella oxytoca KONIH1]AUV91583.1 hypothetical protein C2U44_11210 [Klebsiella oxytoca]MBG2598221.1 hypothetical protein [Klebsiella oxytoca]MDT8625558.1 hypothetical protein [Klebsiella grimontii]POT86210.1 hypothetical protein C3417_21920 [Klebsiella oxytoca]